MNTKLLKMDLLNSEELIGIKGGKETVIFEKCGPFGVGGVKIVLCATYEASCPGTFNCACGLGDVQCSINFTIKEQ